MAKKKAAPQVPDGMLREGEELIHEGNYTKYQTDVKVDGERKARGLIRRNYSKYPRGCYAAALAVDVPLTPRVEWPDRIRQKITDKSQLSDVRLAAGPGGAPVPSRDQNGKGYCWFHSGTSAMLLVRATQNEAYADLSAYAGACVIKNFRDEGGWGAQGLDFQMSRGIPTSEFWPQRSMDKKNDTPATWENAKLHRITEGFIDLAAAQYDRNLTFDQVASLLLSDVPVIVDYNWWSHSVCAMDLLDLDPSKPLTSVDRWGIRIWNSWGDSWSDRGMGALAGKKAVPDGAVAPRVTTPSPA